MKIEKSYKGYRIVKKDNFNHNFYYNGKVWVTDYLYAKNYKTKTEARKALDILDN